MPTSKKPTTKKAVPSKTTAKKGVSKKVVQVPKMKSFKLAKHDYPFFSHRITKQTFYWSTLLIIILILQLWILDIQLDIIEITESINFSS